MLHNLMPKNSLKSWAKFVDFIILCCKIPFRRAWQFQTATERCLMPEVIKLSGFCDPVLQDTVPSRLASSHRDGTVNLPNHYFQHLTNHTGPCCAVNFWHVLDPRSRYLAGPPAPR